MVGPGSKPPLPMVRSRPRIPTATSLPSRLRTRLRLLPMAQRRQLLRPHTRRMARAVLQPPPPPPPRLPLPRRLRPPRRPRPRHRLRATATPATCTAATRCRIRRVTRSPIYSTCSALALLLPAPMPKLVLLAARLWLMQRREMSLARNKLLVARTRTLTARLQLAAWRCRLRRASVEFFPNVSNVYALTAERLIMHPTVSPYLVHFLLHFGFVDSSIRL